jgi:hypothetical protein
MIFISAIVVVGVYVGVVAVVKRGKRRRRRRERALHAEAMRFTSPPVQELTFDDDGYAYFSQRATSTT